MTDEIRFSVLSPVAEGQKVSAGAGSPLSMATRPDTLENKTIYLVDTGFSGSAYFMVELQKWFARICRLLSPSEEKIRAPFYGGRIQRPALEGDQGKG